MRRFIYSFAFAGVLTAMGLSTPVVATPTYNNADLKGEFLFTIVEMRREILSPGTLPVNRNCVNEGTAVFDGVGTMTGSGVQRCSITGTEPVSGKPLFYVVNPDGSFLMSETMDMADPIHGQIVDHGRSLLLDGTTRTMSGILSWSGVMMKR